MRRLVGLFCIVFSTTANAQTDALSTTFPVDSGYFSSFDGVKIYYESRGKGKTVLLVHGFIVNSSATPAAQILLQINQ